MVLRSCPTLYTRFLRANSCRVLHAEGVLIRESCLQSRTCSSVKQGAFVGTSVCTCGRFSVDPNTTPKRQIGN